MFRALNKFFGSLAGFVLYPLKSLIISLLLIALALILTAAALVGMPILAAIIFGSLAEENKLSTALIAGFVALGITLIVTPLVSGLVLFSLAAGGIKDFFRAAVFGLSDGYQNGLFFHVLWRSLSDFIVFNSNLRIAVAVLNAMGSSRVEGIDEQALAQLGDENDVDFYALEDVPVVNQPNDFSDIVEQPSQVVKKVFKPLTSEELELARSQDSVSALLASYNDLHQRLTLLDEEIRNRGTNHDADLATLEDELVVYTAIKEPALLVKQYQDDNGRWRAIPGLTKIVDKATQEQWLRLNKTHPTTREPLDGANPYNDKPARYRMRVYKNMNDAQELIEASILIRQELKKLNPANIQPAAVISSVRSLIQSNTGLFGSGNRVAEQERLNTNPEEERSLSYSS
ncbi:hypothetical protein BN59_03534 [Legionella massiliensis]|uniref:Coiled coil protein n=1 Tax=Legionella massiliensis TaxID=1034943 RepID=A0A078L1Z4_9GAMM|nr:hypothetical protein [Legionella massiliensis]CDZ79216.1 hypothetical protein BN59_03534 [Legionella massiliensis]CEE14954.1 hypothetical protein BN1094_03534 [Legionella massiliensis]